MSGLRLLFPARCAYTQSPKKSCHAIRRMETLTTGGEPSGTLFTDVPAIDHSEGGGPLEVADAAASVELDFARS
ncbi:hypothetical protein GCM10009689_12690 [Brevibacterium antiquum]